MKKALVILLALALVFGLVLTACDIGGGGGGGGKKPSPTPEVPGGELEWKVVFNMQDAPEGTVDHGIQELAVGPLSFSSAPGGNPIAPLVRAAEDQHADFEIIEVDGKKAIKYVTHANWGPGFDLRNSVFGFRDGDKITVIGKAEGAAINLAFNKTQGGAQTVVGNKIETEGDFTVEVELTADDVAAITGSGNEQKVLRFEDRAASDTTVTITQIRIEGNRPSTMTQLAAPVISLSDSTVSWAAIQGASGYSVLSGGEVKTTITGTSINILTTNEFAPGPHTITVVAVGTAGSTSDSDPSNAVSYTKPVPAEGTLALTVESADDFDYAPGDGPSGTIASLKGNIDDAVSADILSGDEVRLYWVSTKGSAIAANNGIGAFGGKNYNSGTGGMAGIVKIPVSELDLSAQPSYVPATQVYLNPYNDAAIIKIEVYDGTDVVLTVESADDFDYAPGDGPSGTIASLKGNIDDAVSADILSGDEVRLYWVSTKGSAIAANNGIGAFGGKNYNSGTGGMAGIVKIPIGELDLSAQPSYVPATQVYLNPYNDAAIVKIEVYTFD